MDNNSIGKNGNPRGKSVSKQVSLGLLANFSSIAPSMSLGFSAVALPILKESLNLSQLSWFASTASLATPFGCFFAGPFADKYGRRKAMFFVNTVCLLGWIIIASFCCLKETHFWLLVLGRILTGLSTGLCSSPATVYMAEISTPDLRGIFTTWASVTFSLGVLIVYFLGYVFKSNLGAICLVTAILPCIGICFTTFLIPESPTWLIGKNKIEEAKLTLCKIYNAKDCTSEVLEELQTLVKNKSDKLFIAEKNDLLTKFNRKFKQLSQPHCLRPIGLVLIYFMFQQFCGIFVIIFYAIDIVNSAGITFDAYLTIVVIAIVRLLSAILPSFLARRFGRRPLSIFSGLGMTLCLLPLALFIYLTQTGSINGEKFTYLPMVLLLLYFITSSIGFLPLPFALAAELFPTNIRGTAAGLTSGIGYFFNFVTVQIYPDMKKFLGISGTFCFYGCMAFIGTIFVSVFLPETKGKSLQEIEEYFGKKQFKEEEQGLKEIASET